MEREKGNLNINDIIKNKEEENPINEKEERDGASSSEETSSSTKEMAKITL